ncbi:organic solute transporter subunit alpha-like [Apostichopus japonicus]|uniref:organic solute transporter subunit alpha-like n=1 Tax=Stichopus japonicus TaxID=307972 RepID=UPI003AB6E28A
MGINFRRGTLDQYVMNCTDVTVTASDVYKAYLQNGWSTAIFCTTIIFAVLTYALYGYLSITIHKRTQFGPRRIFVVRLIGLFPIFSLTSLTGFLVPRASNIAKWGSSMYLAHTIYSFLLLLIDYYGGPQDMINTICRKPVSIARAPLACCFAPFLPEVQLDVKRFHLIRYLVLQVTIIRPTCVFLNAVMWADGVQEDSFVDPLVAGLYLQVVTMVSTLIAVYGLQIFYHASLEYLRQEEIRPKFAILQTVLLSTNIESFIFTLLARLDAFPCIGPWTSGSRTDVVYNIIVVHEMFIFLLVFALLHLRNRRRQTQGFGAVSRVEVEALPSKRSLSADQINEIAEDGDGLQSSAAIEYNLRNSRESVI